MAHTSQLRALGVPLDRVDAARDAIEAIAAEYLGASRAELPEGFAASVAGAIARRATPHLRALAAAAFVAGLQHPRPAGAVAPPPQPAPDPPPAPTPNGRRRTSK
jgi:hypothetical protein